MLEYHAAYYKEESGWYVVRLIDFPGVLSQGRTLQSARRMIRDALQSMADWYMEDGQPMPKPNPRARDKHADHTETVRLRARVERGAST
jgi:predicted RNase H-like HicB family nuclease